MKRGAFHFSSLSIQCKVHLFSDGFPNQPSWWELFPVVARLISAIHMHSALTVLCQEFHLLETQLDRQLLEGGGHVLYLLCVLTGLRIIAQSTSDQVTCSVSRKFLLTSKTHITNCPVALPQLLASSHWLHHFNSLPWFTSIIFILHQLPVCSTKLGS